MNEKDHWALRAVDWIGRARTAFWLISLLGGGLTVRFREWLMDNPEWIIKGFGWFLVAIGVLGVLARSRYKRRLRIASLPQLKQMQASHRTEVLGKASAELVFQNQEDRFQVGERLQEQLSIPCPPHQDAELWYRFLVALVPAIEREDLPFTRTIWSKMQKRIES